MLYPLTFRPIFKERVWGGRRLAELFGKHLPPHVPIGESWEISDRPGDVSVISNGPLAGKDLHWVLEHYEDRLLGNASSEKGRFPILVKLLDAREKLSLQVHPPAHKAAVLGGEPKTEMWYIAEADPGAELYVGLKTGTTRGLFEKALRDGTVENCFHRQPVAAGDAMFLPSGRVHAIGAGLVIFEIQQNSDTTYRVHDWNRVGLDGKPRDLHLEQSLASIDFSDFEPPLLPEQAILQEGWQVRCLVQHRLFSVTHCFSSRDQSSFLQGGHLRIVAALSGTLEILWQDTAVILSPGEFCLIPACLKQVQVAARGSSAHLRVETGRV
jgi:mannose-6-phosphate isomerase